MFTSVFDYGPLGGLDGWTIYCKYCRYNAVLQCRFHYCCQQDCETSVQLLTCILFQDFHIWWCNTTFWWSVNLAPRFQVHTCCWGSWFLYSCRTNRHIWRTIAFQTKLRTVSGFKLWRKLTIFWIWLLTRSHIFIPNHTIWLHAGKRLAAIITVKVMVIRVILCFLSSLNFLN